MTASDEQSLYAARLILEGELIVFPTDTVYGVGSDAFSSVAVSRLLATKGRGETMPPPVLAADIDDALALGDFGERKDREADVRRIAKRFWPGALTLVIPTTRQFGWGTEAVGNTVAVRVPDDPVARTILSATGPIAVTSANRTGELPATTVTQARGYFGSEVALYVDGGPHNGGQPSTILNCAGEDFEIMRPGPIGWEQISSAL